MPTIEWSVRSVRDEEDVHHVRSLFQRYRDWLSDVDELCFKGFDEEIAALPGVYAAPGGTLLLAVFRGDPVGCVGVRPLKQRLPAGRARLKACELKRLFVMETARGLGIGRALLRRALRDAHQMRYEAMVLDTISEKMRPAKTLYEEFGFVPIEPYFDGAPPEIEFMFRRLT